MCVARPVSDLVLREDRAPDDRALPALRPRGAGGHRDGGRGTGRWTCGGSRLGVDAPHHFYAGQFMEIEVPGQPGEWRAYSVSSAPSSNRALEFILKHIPGGSFSGQPPRMAVGDALVLRGPFGDGYLRAGTDRVLLVGVGSGLAPLLSILRHAAECQ